MRAQDFLAKVDITPRLFLISGEEEYFIHTSREAIVSALGCGELNTDVRGAGASLEDIAIVAEQFPCFSEFRLIILENSYFFSSEDGENLADYLKKAPASTKFMFVCSTPPDKRRVLYKYLLKNALVIDAQPLDEETLSIWLRAACKKAGFAIKNADARLLAEICGSDMFVLKNEIEKLAMLKKRTVEAEDIRSCASASDEYDVFLLHGYMLKGEYAPAVALAKKIYAAEKSFIPLVALLSGKFELMLEAKTQLASGKSRSAALKSMTEELKASLYPSKYALNECSGFSLEGLKRALKVLATYELALKSGGADPGIESILLKLYASIER